MHVADLDGDGRDDLLIAGSDRFGVLQTGRKGQRLKTIASYETKRTEGKLSDLAAGDLNADGVADVVFTDVNEQMLEIATYTGDKDLLHAIAFKLFERKIFRGTGDINEPRDQADRRRRRRRPGRRGPDRPRPGPGAAPGSWPGREEGRKGRGGSLAVGPLLAT